MPPSTVVLQLPGGPELLILALIVLSLLVFAVIGFVLVRRLLDASDRSRVAELEREVVDLREQVERLEDRVGDDSSEDDGWSD